MPPACDLVTDAGNCLLMATHQLKQQPFSNKVRYNLVDSARNILEGTMKVQTCLITFFRSWYFVRFFTISLEFWGEQGWCSIESTALPPVWPGFDSQSRHHMLVEFVVGSPPCSKGISLGSPVFLPPQKSTLQIPIQPGNSGQRTTMWMYHCQFPNIYLIFNCVILFQIC